MVRYRRSIIFVMVWVIFTDTTAAQSHFERPAAAASAAEAPVVIEGVVPDQSTKARLLAQLGSVYGSRRVVDRIQVEAIATPPNWSDYVEAMLMPALNQVSQGQLEIHGQTVRISGDIATEASRQQLTNDLSLASNNSYTVTNTLKVGPRQAQLDRALDDRIIEFQSGSAALTPTGMRILDDMAEVMLQMTDERLLVVGHTDDVGRRDANLVLSDARATAVMRYLIEHGVPARALEVEGKGPDEPIADNETAEGRARNRRIQFRAL